MEDSVNATVLSAINEQINSEFEASYTYLAMVVFCERQRFLDVLAPEVRSQVELMLQVGHRIPEEVLGPDELRSAWGDALGDPIAPNAHGGKDSPRST